MTTGIQSAEEATPAWLTQTLYEAGILKSGRVVQVEKRANTAYHAETTRLQLSYSGVASEQPPTQLFLKILNEHKGRREVEVYRRLMALPHYPEMTVPCYNAAYDSTSGRSSLLLADVSRTHHEVSSRAEVRAFTAAPPLWQVEAIVDTLARWHALGWGFGGTVHLPAERFDVFTDEASYQSYAAHCKNAWFRFAEAESALAAKYEALYLPLIEAMPQLWQGYWAERLCDTANLTLAHGDCYFSQFLCPARVGGQTFIIDFDRAHLDTPADDLVFLTSFWQREARLEHEWAMLERYYHNLSAAGVATYSWEAFLNDYRFSLVQHAMYPILGKLSGDDERFWRSRLVSITAAYEAWNCTRLLQGIIQDQIPYSQLRL